jgi:hypothetical protein
MKWQAAKYSRKDRKKLLVRSRNTWHRRFAWRPIAIPERDYDGIVVPRHWVWLERVARKARDNDGREPYIFAPYGGQPSLRQLTNQ